MLGIWIQNFNVQSFDSKNSVYKHPTNPHFQPSAVINIIKSMQNLRRVWAEDFKDDEVKFRLWTYGMALYKTVSRKKASTFLQIFKMFASILIKIFCY